MVEGEQPAREGQVWEEKSFGIQAWSAATLPPITMAMLLTSCPGETRRRPEKNMVLKRLDFLSETPGSARVSAHDYSLPLDLKCESFSSSFHILTV